MASYLWGLWKQWYGGTGCPLGQSAEPFRPRAALRLKGRETGCVFLERAAGLRELRLAKRVEQMAEQKLPYDAR